VLIHISTIVHDSILRGRNFGTSVLSKGTLSNTTGMLAIDERDWLIACDRWPNDPVRRATDLSENAKPCC